MLVASFLRVVPCMDEITQGHRRIVVRWSLERQIACVDPREHPFDLRHRDAQAFREQSIRIGLVEAQPFEPCALTP